jgi:hypothetical protein
MLEDTNVLYESETEPNLAMYYNMMYARTKFNAPDTLVSMIGDDMEFKTKGWDKIIIEKANEICGVGIIHCDDGFMQRGNIPVNLFTSREYVDACGSEYMCSKFKRFWIDTIWGEVSTRTDTNYYLPNVLIKHNHTTLKGQYDETYRRLEELAKVESVGGVEQYKNKIWPDVYMRIANLKRSGLI